MYAQLQLSFLSCVQTLNQFISMEKVLALVTHRQHLLINFELIEVLLLKPLLFCNSTRIVTTMFVAVSEQPDNDISINYISNFSKDMRAHVICGIIQDEIRVVLHISKEL